LIGLFLVDHNFLDGDSAREQFAENWRTDLSEADYFGHEKIVSGRIIWDRLVRDNPELINLVVAVAKIVAAEYSFAEIKDYYKMVEESNNPKPVPVAVQTKVNEIIAKVISSGITRFDDIMKAIYERFGEEKAQKFFPFVKSSYASYLINAENSSLKNFDSLPDVRRKTFDNFIKCYKR
jgi:hypothetical protein